MPRIQQDDDFSYKVAVAIRENCLQGSNKYIYLSYLYRNSNAGLPCAESLKICHSILIITLGAHAQRGYCSCPVCLSVTLNLTSRVFVRLTKDTTYLTGNEGQKIFAVFSENAPLQS